MVNSRYIWKL